MSLAIFQNVSRLYPTGKGVQDLSFSLDFHQSIGLLGLNGSGKTTTLKLLAGLMLPDRGQIQIAGQKPRKARQEISFLSDKDSFDMWMKPKDVCAFMQAFYPDFRTEVFPQLCDRLQVPTQSLNSMSKGQQQRLRLAACFSRKASLYLLDEPLSGIDVISREMILRILAEHRQIGSTMVISTHEIKEIEVLLDRVLILRDGNLVLDQLKPTSQRREDSFTQKFIDLHL
ncbi:MAG: ATP-binding cassette domain-containing protein [Oligoflexus sp.]